MVARLPEPRFTKYTCLLLSDQPTFQGKVPRGKEQEQELKSGGRFLSCVPQNVSPGRPVGPSPGLEPVVRRRKG